MLIFIRDSRFSKFIICLILFFFDFKQVAIRLGFLQCILPENFFLILLRLPFSFRSLLYPSTSNPFFLPSVYFLILNWLDLIVKFLTKDLNWTQFWTQLHLLKKILIKSPFIPHCKRVYADSSVIEQRIRNAWVVGSNPILGSFVNTFLRFVVERFYSNKV